MDQSKVGIGSQKDGCSPVCPRGLCGSGQERGSSLDASYDVIVHCCLPICWDSHDLSLSLLHYVLQLTHYTLNIDHEACMIGCGNIQLEPSRYLGVYFDDRGGGRSGLAV